MPPIDDLPPEGLRAFARLLWDQLELLRRDLAEERAARAKDRAQIRRLVTMIEGLTRQLDELLRDRDDERKADLARFREEARAAAEATQTSGSPAVDPAATSRTAPSAESTTDAGPSTPEDPPRRKRDEHGRGKKPDSAERHERLSKETRCRRCGKDKAYRKAHAAPVAAEFREWLDKHINDPDGLLPSHPVRKAMQYYINHWDALTLFLRDPAVPVDNHWSERALRKVALLRNNYLYAGGVDGAVRLCTLFTLIGTCRQLGVDPFDYLEWALTRMVPHPSNRGLVPDDLTPAAYKAAHQKQAH